MKCPFCENKEIEAFDNVQEHLIIVKGEDETYHIHGPIEDKDKVYELLTFAAHEVYKNGIENYLITFKGKDGKFTVQSSTTDKEKLKEFIFAICSKNEIPIEGK